jgi:hypothetical protein
MVLAADQREPPMVAGIDESLREPIRGENVLRK